ncbi:MAG: ABC transporter permease [Spirochaetaceae bacterium]|nr:ABC transporter permease [Spirochaetaceae bacterium]
MKKKQASIMRNNAAPFAALAVLVLLWQFLCAVKIVPPYMLPSPAKVCAAFINDFPLLMTHLRFTLFEAALGLALAIIAAFALALFMDINACVKRALNPLLLLTQTLPVIAIAPLLVLWLGYGCAPKVSLVFITCFFPVTVSLVSGFAHTDGEAACLLRSMGASRAQIYRFLKIPQALPSFFAGLRISASYAVSGAVIAEWLGGDGGLGVYMIRVRKSYAFDKMFASIFLTVIVSLVLLKMTAFLECYALPWRGRREVKRKR